MKMKKFVSILVALAIAIVPLCAFAAPGDATLLRNGQNDYSGGLIGVVELNGTIYMLAYDKVFTFGEGDARPVSHALRLTLSDSESATETDGDSTNTQSSTEIKAIVVYDGRPCLLLVKGSFASETDEDGETSYSNTVDGAYLYELVFDDAGQAALGEKIVTLDWEDGMLNEEDDYQYSRACVMPFVMGDTLYFSSYDDSGITFVMAYDLQDGSGTQLEPEFPADARVNGLCAYKDNSLLLLTVNWTGEGPVSKLYTFDCDSEEATELAEMPKAGYAHVGGLAYSAEKDTIYYLLNGELCAFTGTDVASAVPVADVPITDVESFAPVLTADGLYIAASYDAVIRRNTDPALRATKRLTVQNPYVSTLEEAYYTFTNLRGDVTVALVTQVEDVVQAMMNRSTSVDVYCLNVPSAEYDAVFSRGYMAELSGSEKLTSLMSGAYGFVRDVCEKDGVLVAIPMELYTNGRGYDPEAFAKVGLSEADVPTTWVDFFASLEPLAKKLEDYPGMSLFEAYNTKSSIRSTFFSAMLQDYMTYISQPGNEFAFDTPVFRALLAAFDAVNWDALGLPEDDEAENAGPVSEHGCLYAAYADASAGNYSADPRLLPLKLSDDIAPLITGSMTVAFVNPFSENIEDAIAYLETAADELDAMVKIHMFPGENEPIRERYYESNVKSYEEQIASLKENLEKAAEDDKQAYRDSLAELERGYQRYLDNDSWRASPQSIARYRKFAENIVISRNIGVGSGNAEEFFMLISQYTDGMISSDDFIAGIDRKLQMMMKEGQ